MPFIKFVQQGPPIVLETLYLGFLFQGIPGRQYTFYVAPRDVDAARMVMSNLLRELLMNSVLGKPNNRATREDAQLVIQLFIESLIEDGGIQY